MQKPRTADKKKGGRRRNQNREDSNEEQDLVDPQMYLNFACSSDMKRQSCLVVLVSNRGAWMEQRSTLRLSVPLTQILW